MILNELKEHLYDIVAGYFVGATVVWVREKVVKPAPNFVTLSIGNVSRPVRPVTEFIDGVPCGCYPSKARFEVNLYTKGDGFSMPGKRIVAAQNTAVNDMLDFVNYINSAFVTNICHELDIDISMNGTVNDVSDYINDVRWQYRAMVEFDIGFTQTAVGAAGILSESSIKTETVQPGRPGDMQKPQDVHVVPEWQQTSSGGGSNELAAKDDGYFELVRTEEEKEE